MKIKELLESTTPRDKTRKDHNGNFLGYDPDRKVWVVIPRYDGIGMIRRGELANGVLKIGTDYPEFSPSAAPPKIKDNDPNVGKFQNWMRRKSDEWNKSSKSIWHKEINDLKRRALKNLI